jgi:signal transduction histidine kinase
LSIFQFVISGFRRAAAFGRFLAREATWREAQILQVSRPDFSSPPPRGPAGGCQTLLLSPRWKTIVRQIMARLLHSVFQPVRIGFTLGFLFLAGAAGAQEARDWRLFAAEDGMEETSAATVSLAPRGEVIFTHDSGQISLFDGYDFQTLKGLPLSSYRILRDPSGVLWTVYPEGLAEWRDEVWLIHPLADIQQEFKTHVLRRSSWVQPLGLGRVLFLLPEHLMEFDASKSTPLPWKLAAQTGLGRFSDLAPARDGGLWITGNGGLAKLPRPLDLLQHDSKWEEFLPPLDYRLHNFNRPFPDESGGVVELADQGADDRKVIVHFDGQKQWTLLEPPSQSIRWAWAGLEGSYWSATISQLYHRERSGSWLAVPKDVMPAEKFLDAAVGTGGVFWLATSAGAYRHSPPAWRRPPFWNLQTAPVFAIFEDFESRLWRLQKGSLSREEAEGWSSFPLPPGLPSGATNGIAFPLSDGTIVLQLGEQVFRFDPAQNKFSEIGARDGARRKVLGRLDAGRLCFQVLASEPARGAPSFECFDGKSLAPCHDLPADLDLGTELRFAHATQDGDLWLGGSSFIALRRLGHWKVFSDPDSSAPRGPSGIMEAGDGKVWVAASGGISQFDGKSWSPAPLPSGAGGMKGVNAMARSTDGRIWVASNSGLWRYFKDEWTSVSVEEGLPAATVLAVYEDSRGRIWAGASNGISLYHPEADADPPRTRISRVTTDKSDSADALFYFFSRDKWKVTPPERLLYSYNLDGNRWTPLAPYRPGDHELRLPGLSPGKHVIYVRAADRNWNVEDPRQMLFSIPLPWYLDLRLMAISAAGLVAVIFFAVLALNRHLRLLRSYAEVERIVALRTEQLEKANRGLLQSQKMNALGALAAGVAHDFNNILSIIKGSAQIIETSLEDREKVRLRLSRIMTVVNQGATIVKAMLGFSRESDQQPAVCDLNSVVQETISLLGDHALENIGVEFDWAPGLPPVSVQKDYIQQILVNFVLNARDAMNGRGRVILRTGETKSPPPDLALAPGPAELYLFVSVKDFGAGITPEVRSRIFEPFFTTKAFSTQRGTGLGLSMAYEMARHTQAGLQVQSEPAHGSTFTLFLPVPVIRRAAQAQPGLETFRPRV